MKYEVDDYMKEMICSYKNISHVKKSKTKTKIKRWIYDLFDTLGIASGFSG